MQKRLRLSKKRQELAAEYVDLARMLARFFVQNRPAWQKGVLVPDLEGEGFLALTKAARTYDPKKLPYPKAYFARACLNAMYKAIKKTTRQPGEWKISLQEAEDLLPVLENPDYLGLAIQDLPAEHQQLAADRFQEGQTLRTIAEGHDISLRAASVRSRELARNLAAALDIRLAPHAPEGTHRTHGSSPMNPSSSPASSRSRGKGPRRS
jgi:RNA polymerase sigma factor (sigma-70 family)